MSVVYAKQTWTGQTASDDITRHRTYATEYEVVVDNILDDATVAGGPGTAVPRLGDPYPNDAGAIVVNVSPTRDDDNPYRWFVTVSYDTELPFKGESQSINPATGESSPTPSPTQRENNPTLRPPVWRYSHNSFTKILVTAINGVSIWQAGLELFDSQADPVGGKPDKVVVEADGSVLVTNSAGDPFDPPVEVEEYRLVIDVTWYTTGVNHVSLSNYIGAVNNAAWYGFAARTCRVRVNDASSEVMDGYNVWQRHVQIEVNDDTWDIPLLDRGPRGWVPGSMTPDPDDPATLPKYLNFTNGDGSEAVELLDGQGAKLAAGESPVYLYYRAFRELNFAGLGIP